MQLMRDCGIRWFRWHAGLADLTRDAVRSGYGAKGKGVDARLVPASTCIHNTLNRFWTVAVGQGLGGDEIESKGVSLIPAFRLTVASLRCGSSNVPARPVEQPTLAVPFGWKQHLDSSGTFNLGDGNEKRDGRNG